ncbi:hypothetical protein CK203_037684 [Vitis vinifera]|uniref:Uncharacterized protein n=1 Tax=Vitis vinifera TaxID=29760 RepID=A0A438HKM4_VITVI|nr:hypothetical protein CK203_037684 [Vitis vinifera]
MLVVCPGGKCWFGVDSKTFEVSIKETKGRDVEEKRFSLVFPKERGFVRGWKILSSKLRSLGVSLIQRRVEESNAASKKVLVPSGIGNKKEGSIVEAMPFGSFEQCEAERVLCLEVKWFNGKNFFLDWLNPSIECLKEERAFGKRGFVAVDDEMVERQKLQFHHGGARCSHLYFKVKGRLVFFAKGRGGIVFAEIRANGSVESHPSPFVTTESIEALNPCASKLSSLEMMSMFVAGEALRFQGIERGGEGFLELGGGVSERVLDAVKGPLINGSSR